MSLYFGNRLHKIVRAPEGDGTGGGGAPDAAALKAEIEKLKTAHAQLMSENENLKKGSKKKPKDVDETDDDETDDSDLNQKAEKERQARAKSAQDHKNLESALTFNMQSAEFLKNNQSLLPKDAADIFAQAEKETYSTAIEKANAIRAGLIKSFFAIQDNKDLLTGGPKSDLEEYLKLVPNERIERAQKIWSSVFEPTLEMLRRVKKAAAVNGENQHSTDAQAEFRNRMIALSKKHHLGVKPNA